MSKKIFSELEKINKEVLAKFEEFGWVEWKKYENDLAYPFWKLNIATETSTDFDFKDWSKEITAELMKVGKTPKVEPKSDVTVGKVDTEFKKYAKMESLISETNALFESFGDAKSEDVAVMLESSLVKLTNEYASLDPESDEAKDIKSMIEAQLSEWTKKHSFF